MRLSESQRERRLVLASASPRRQELLVRLGFDPVVRPPAIPEVRGEGEPPVDFTRRLSLEKAAVVAREGGVRGDRTVSPFVVAADTVVLLGDEVLEKPRDAADAREMLQRLSGRWHRVVTSFTVLHSARVNKPTTRTVEAGVQFRALTEREIARYVETGEPLDKAGAYGVQHVGSFLVREVRGSYFTVVGLPVCELVETLLSVGAVTEFPFHEAGGSAGREEAP
jgi:septum formation protein